MNCQFVLNHLNMSNICLRVVEERDQHMFLEG